MGRWVGLRTPHVSGTLISYVYTYSLGLCFRMISAMGAAWISRAWHGVGILKADELFWVVSVQVWVRHDLTA